MVNVTGRAARQLLAARMLILQLKFEAIFAKRLTSALASQARASAKAFRASGDESTATLAARSRRNNIEKALITAYRRAGAFFGTNFFKSVEKSAAVFTTKDERGIFEDALRNWITTEATKQISLIEQTTQDNILSAIRAGAEEGEGQNAIARRIFKRLAGEGNVVARSRARMIARTEVHSAMSFATQAAAKSTGLTLEKEWLTTADERARETHNEADGQRQAMKEAYDVGSAKLMRPGDPSGPPEEIINCRCSEIFHTV